MRDYITANYLKESILNVTLGKMQFIHKHLIFSKIKCNFLPNPDRTLYQDKQQVKKAYLQQKKYSDEWCGLFKCVFSNKGRTARFNIRIDIVRNEYLNLYN